MVVYHESRPPGEEHQHTDAPEGVRIFNIGTDLYRKQMGLGEYWLRTNWRRLYLVSFLRL